VNMFLMRRDPPTKRPRRHSDGSTFYHIDRCCRGCDGPEFETALFDELSHSFGSQPSRANTSLVPAISSPEAHRTCSSLCRTKAGGSKTLN
jgi:hypothetical protein